MYRSPDKINAAAPTLGGRSVIVNVCPSCRRKVRAVITEVEVPRAARVVGSPRVKLMVTVSIEGLFEAVFIAERVSPPPGPRVFDRALPPSVPPGEREGVDREARTPTYTFPPGTEEVRGRKGWLFDEMTDARTEEARSRSRNGAPFR